jgi:hypothetical protein
VNVTFPVVLDGDAPLCEGGIFDVSGQLSVDPDLDVITATTNAVVIPDTRLVTVFGDGIENFRNRPARTWRATK